MEEGQERDDSPDEQGHVIDNDDDEDSLTDTPDLWIPERNEEDTKSQVVRASMEYSDQEAPRVSVGTVDC